MAFWHWLARPWAQAVGCRAPTQTLESPALACRKAAKVKASPINPNCQRGNFPQSKRENAHWAPVGMEQPGQGCCHLPLTDWDVLDLPLSTQEELNLSLLQPPSVFSLSWVFPPEEGLNPHISPDFSFLAPSIHPKPPVPTSTRGHCPYFSLNIITFI